MVSKFQEAFDVRIPFFRPAWRRAALTLFCFVWAGVEFWNGSSGWASLFAAIGGYLFWQFFVRFDPADYEKTTED
jgi:hypothetical protein